MTRTRAMTRLARDIIQELALDLPFDHLTFVARLAQARGLVISLKPFPMVGTMSGYCARLDETHYIVFHDTGLAPERFARVLYHEAAHIILGHVPRAAPTLVAFLALARVEGKGVTLPRHRYSLDSELDAEALAMALSALSVGSLVAAAMTLTMGVGEPSSRLATFYNGLGF